MCLRGTVRSDRRSYVTRVQLTDPDWEFIEPYLPIGEYGPYPKRLRQQFEGVILRASMIWIKDLTRATR